MYDVPISPLLDALRWRLTCSQLAFYKRKASHRSIHNVRRMFRDWNGMEELKGIPNHVDPKLQTQTEAPEAYPITMLNGLGAKNPWQ